MVQLFNFFESRFFFFNLEYSFCLLWDCAAQGRPYHSSPLATPVPSTLWVGGWLGLSDVLEANLLPLCVCTIPRSSNHNTVTEPTTARFKNRMLKASWWDMKGRICFWCQFMCLCFLRGTEKLVRREVRGKTGA